MPRHVEMGPQKEDAKSFETSLKMSQVGACLRKVASSCSFVKLTAEVHENEITIESQDIRAEMGL